MELYTIGNEKLKISVNIKGAEMNHVIYNGKERLWQGDERFWKGHAPLLFPVAGALKDKKYNYNGKTFDMPFHGFLRGADFKLVDISDNEVTFLYCGDSATFEYYPFDFEFYVRYKVVKDSLEVTFKVVNKGDKPMWFSFGSHESYNIDCELEESSLVFEKDEEFLSPIVVSPSGLIERDCDDFGKGNELKLGSDKFIHDTIVLKDINSRAVSILENGKRRATLQFDTPNLLCWSKEGAKFICVEPWHNVPDYVDSDGNIGHKEGVILIDGGQEYTNTHIITYFD